MYTYTSTCKKSELNKRINLYFRVLTSLPYFGGVKLSRVCLYPFMNQLQLSSITAEILSVIPSGATVCLDMSTSRFA